MAARNLFASVFAGWDTSDDPRSGKGGGDPGWWGIQRGIEAQVAAAALGYKPLYFDPWHPGHSEALAERLGDIVPSGTQLAASSEGLFVWRRDAIRAVLETDPAFYRAEKLDEWEAILHFTRLGQNGELLGYGARSLRERGTARVMIYSRHGLFMSFMSRLEQAEHWAAQRALDIVPCVDVEVLYKVDFP